MLAVLLINSLNVGLLIHMIPLLEGIGLSAGQATLLAGGGHVGGIAGTLLIGALVHRIPGNLLGAITFAMLALSCGLLVVPGTLAACAVPVLIQAIAGGGMLHLYPYLTTRYFGMRAYGSIFGVVAALMALAIGIGPLLAGLVFDVTRSYDLFLTAAIPISLFVALLIYSLDRYPDFGEGEATAAVH